MRIRGLVAAASVAIISMNSVSAAVSPSGGTRPMHNQNHPMQATHPAPPRVPRTDKAPLVESYLQAGNLAGGETALIAHLKENPKDDQARFGLGMLQFLLAVQGLGQDLYRYGVRSAVDQEIRVPFLRMPVPENAQPQTISYVKARDIAKKMLARFTAAEATMSQITDPNVKMPLHFGLIKLDLNGDGTATEPEALWRIYAEISRNRTLTEESAKQFDIAFDRGDVHWLRGYCHVLSAFCEFYLAHDTKQMFESTAHLFFPRVDTPNKFLVNRPLQKRGRFNSDVVFDLVALVHLVSWDVVEPERMKAVLNHLEAMTVQSKESWRFIMAETDDDREWLPNPRQTGVLPNMKVTDAMVTSWTGMMDEIHRLLAGEVLIPFWRASEPGVGINLRRVFTEPTKFDLVLWIQGTCATPYLEHGKLTDKDLWRRLRDVFGNSFPGFAIWFN